MSVNSNYLNERIVPWDKTTPSYNRTLKVIAITFIAVASIALVMQIMTFALPGINPASLHSLIQVNTVYSSLIFSCACAGLALSYIMGTIYQKRKKQAEAENEKKWIIEHTKNNTQCAFDVKDPAPQGLGWNQVGKKRVLIISSKEGGAHVTGAEATKQALKEAGYDPYVVYPGQYFDYGAWYNYCQKNGWNRAQRMLVSMQKTGEYWNAFEIVNRAMRSAIYTYKPQLIISVQPIANGFLASEAQKLHIPLIILSTDFYSRHFLSGINRPPQTFTASLLTNDEKEMQVLSKLYPTIGKSNICILGAMLRKPFEIDQEEARQAKAVQLKTDYAINDTDKIGLISMGAQGGSSVKEYCQQLFDYAATIVEEGQKLHVFALCGSNQELQKQINKQFPNQNKLTIHALGWTSAEDVAAFMSIAAFYITKPGGMSTSEAIALNTPVLFDGKTADASPWEPYNMQIASSLGIGQKIEPKNFFNQVQALLQTTEKPQVSEFAGRTFSKNITSHVKAILDDDSPLTPLSDEGSSSTGPTR